MKKKKTIYDKAFEDAQKRTKFSRDDLRDVIGLPKIHEPLMNDIKWHAEQTIIYKQKLEEAINIINGLLVVINGLKTKGQEKEFNNIIKWANKFKRENE